jgi:endonuclease-3
MRESIKNKKIRISQIISILKEEYPDSKCSLIYDSPFQLLVATILSAQCTDERVNKVTSAIFKKYPDAKSFSSLTVKEIGKLIYSTGFYNNKAKNIKKMSDIVWSQYNGEVPDDIDLLVDLPGVGRKTANVVLGNIFNTPALVVDTHVTRISNLLKFVNTKNAVLIEKQLCKIVDSNDWSIFAHLLIDHGRKACIANRPRCFECVISSHCPSVS